MNEDNKKRRSAWRFREIFRLPDFPGGIAAIILMLVSEAVLILFLGLLDILPARFIVLIVMMIAVVDIGTLVLFRLRRRSRVLHISGLVLAAVVILASGISSFYVYSTYDTFSKVSGHLVQSEKFYVVVLKDGSFSTVDDISGKSVYVSKAESRTYKEARGKLATRADVRYKESPDLISAGNKLVDSKGGRHDNILFVSKSNYKMICEEIDGFAKNTNVIYRTSVEVKSDDSSKKVNVTEDSYNIYISGIDVYGDIDQVSRSDVNMIVTVNPKTRTILLTSIPRDTYLPLHTYGAMDKLTHSGIYGIDETVSTVEDWLGVEMNYYVRINFSMLVKMVDAIGGIDVNSKYAFKSAVSDYRYSKGVNHLDGKAALYFTRERKSFKDEDEQRIRNQQLVLKAMVDKISGSTALLTGYTDILDAVKGKMQTDLSDRDIAALVKMQLADPDKWDIKTIVLTGEDSYEYTYSMGQRELFVSIPDEAKAEKAKKAINMVMYPVEE